MGCLNGLITVTAPGLIATKYPAHTASFILLNLAKRDLTSVRHLRCPINEEILMITIIVKFKLSEAITIQQAREIFLSTAPKY